MIGIHTQDGTQYTEVINPQCQCIIVVLWDSFNLPESSDWFWLKCLFWSWIKNCMRHKSENLQVRKKINDACTFQYTVKALKNSQQNLFYCCELVTPWIILLYSCFISTFYCQDNIFPFVFFQGKIKKREWNKIN